jgi:hypothetical protein
MKANQLKTIIRKIRIPTDECMRNKTMIDIKRVHRSRYYKRSTHYIVRMNITPMRITTLAALFLVLLGLIGLSYLKHNHRDMIVQNRTSCVDMLTSRSLRMAYRRGQLEELDKMFERVNKLTGPRPVALSARELMDDIDG